MDSKLVFPAALLVLLSLIQSGLSEDGATFDVQEGSGFVDSKDFNQRSSLQCHQCNSYTDAHCGDPFYHADDALKTPKTMDFLKDCEEGETFCRKIYQNVRGDERVIRSCGSIKDEREGDGADGFRKCYTTVLEEYNTEVCQCDSEGRNSGNL